MTRSDAEVEKIIFDQKKIADVLRLAGEAISALAAVLVAPTRAGSPEDLLSIVECAAILSTGSKAIRRRIADGSLPASRPRGVRGYRVRRVDLDALFAARLSPKPTRVTPRRAPVSDDDRLAAAIADSGITLRRRSA